MHISHLFHDAKSSFFHGSVLEEKHTFFPQEKTCFNNFFFFRQEKKVTLWSNKPGTGKSPYFCRRKKKEVQSGPFLSVLCLFTIAPPENKQKPPLSRHHYQRKGLSSNPKSLASFSGAWLLLDMTFHWPLRTPTPPPLEKNSEDFRPLKSWRSP